MTQNKLGTCAMFAGDSHHLQSLLLSFNKKEKEKEENKIKNFVLSDNFQLHCRPFALV